MNKRKVHVKEHNQKDRFTPKLYRLAREQKNGREIEFGEHQEVLGIPLGPDQMETIIFIREEVRKRKLAERPETID